MKTGMDDLTKKKRIRLAEKWATLDKGRQDTVENERKASFYVGFTTGYQSAIKQLELERKNRINARKG